jgi:hypothetical protein
MKPSTKAELLAGVLKPGEYWIDLFEHEDRSDTQVFADYQKTHGAVKIILAEEIADSDPKRTWIKFKVLGPTDTVWPKSLATQIGFPTPIQPGDAVDESSDTSTAQDVIDHLEETGEDGSSTAKTLMFVGLAAAALAVAVVVSPFVAAWLNNRRKAA